MTRTPIEVRCPLCGQRASIFPGQTLIHAKCPNKKPRQDPPIYQEVKS